jgi:hypothetical protein
MSEPLDPLEQELAGFQPRRASPELRQRIGERLRAPGWTWRHWAVVVGTAAAAGIVVLLAWPAPEPDTKLDSSSRVSTNDLQLAPPTLAAYRRAFEQSPDTLEEMLGQHPALAMREPGEALRAGQRFNPHFLDSLGDR